MNQFSTPILQQAPRVALLVDGENLSSLHADTLILKSATDGTLIVKRVYGNVARLNGWCAAPGFKAVHSGTGKNATDLLLTVEAMSLLLLAQADTLVLASSDGDFTHLAQHLTESGKTVIRIGVATAPDRFRKSCTRFHTLAVPPPVPPAPAAPPASPLDPLVAHARDVLARQPDGLLVADLACALNNLHLVQIRETPHKTWRAFLTAHPALFICDPKGPAARVRLTTLAPR